MGNAGSSSARHDTSSDSLHNLNLKFLESCNKNRVDSERSLLLKQPRNLKGNKRSKKTSMEVPESYDPWLCCRQEKHQPSNHLLARSKVEKEDTICWTQDELTHLEAAVNLVAKHRGVHPPRYRELSKAYCNGQFLTEDAFNFWLRVSRKVKVHNEDECFLKYNELHGTDVVRFSVKESPRNKAASMT
jgi:hypothetical protein